MPLNELDHRLRDQQIFWKSNFVSAPVQYGQTKRLSVNIKPMQVGTFTQGCVSVPPASTTKTVFYPFWSIG